jgi:hypothetical protein
MKPNRAQRSKFITSPNGFFDSTQDVIISLAKDSSQYEEPTIAIISHSPLYDPLPMPISSTYESTNLREELGSDLGANLGVDLDLEAKAEVAVAAIACRR